jgi:thiol:disulfide interchange protein DsbD
MNARSRAVSFLQMAFMVAAGLTLTATASATPYWMRATASNQADFLPPDEAFRLSAHVEGGVLKVRWVIADGYYLYRSRMEIRPESPDLTLDAPGLPAGSKLTDAYLGSQEVYRQQVEATVAYHRLDYGAHPMQIKVFYQGCAQAGLCYPLLTKVIFPEPAPPSALPVQPPVLLPGSSAWEPVAIIGGVLAFLLAGLRLRTDRRPPMPS